MIFAAAQHDAQRVPLSHECTSAMNATVQNRPCRRPDSRTSILSPCSERPGFSAAITTNATATHSWSATAIKSIHYTQTLNLVVQFLFLSQPSVADESHRRSAPSRRYRGKVSTSACSLRAKSIYNHDNLTWCPIRPTSVRTCPLAMSGQYLICPSTTTNTKFGYTISYKDMQST